MEKTQKEERLVEKGFLQGMHVLEGILERLGDENNCYNLENAYEELRDFRNSILFR